MAVDTNGLLIAWDGLEVVSGEGTGEGHVRLYMGALTLQSLRLCLKKERADGDRWAFARAQDGTRYNLGGRHG